MNITEQKTGDLTATLKIEVKEGDYVENYRKEMNNVRRQAVMPGFRPGKVPAGLIEKKYGTAILLEELNKLVSDTLTNHIRDNQLRILGHPIPNYETSLPDYQQKKDFDFFFDIAYSPEINLKPDELEPVDYFKIKFEEKDLDAQIERIGQRYGKVENQDSVEEKDVLNVDFFQLDDNGKELPGGIKKSGQIMVEMIKDEAIREQLIGANIDDVVIFDPIKATGSAIETATLLGIKKEEAEELASDFQFTIKTIERNVPAELNEELFKTIFPHDDLKSEKEFRSRLMKDMELVYALESDKLFGRVAMDHIIDTVTFELPKDFIAKWLYHSNDGKLSHEEINRNLEGYLKYMKVEILENELMQLNPALKITDDDVKNVIKNYFRQYLLPQGQSTEEMDDMLENQLNMMADNYLKEKNKEVDKIREDLYNQRVSEYLNSTVPKKEILVTLEEFNDKLTKLAGQSDRHHNHDHDYDHDHDHDHEHEHDHGQNNTNEQS